MIKSWKFCFLHYLKFVFFVCFISNQKMTVELLCALIITVQTITSNLNPIGLFFVLFKHKYSVYNFTVLKVIKIYVLQLLDVHLMIKIQSLIHLFISNEILFLISVRQDWKSYRRILRLDSWFGESIIFFILSGSG